MELFISDLDGTLLDSQAQLSPVSLKILRMLLSDGLPFTVASARTPFSALPLLASLPLRLPWILMNGALLYDPVRQSFPDSVPLSPQARKTLAQAAERCGISGLLFTLEEGRLRCHCSPAAPPAAQHYFDWTALAPYPALWNGFGRRQVAELVSRPLLYGMYLDDRPQRLEQMASLLDGRGLTLDFYRDRYTEERWYLEVYSAQASKGLALARLRHMGAFTHIVAFGDGQNDLALFDACDEGYAVDNACPALKAHADGIIPSNEADGVAVYLSKRWNCETDFDRQSLHSEYRR